MTAAVRVDAQIRGPIGNTERVETMRVVFVSPFGWVAGINDNGRQRIMNGDFEILEAPRPVKARTDIPARFLP